MVSNNLAFSNVSIASTPMPKDGSTLNIYDTNGSRLALGEQEYRTSGGEGAVYAFPANPKVLIKIYKGETLADPKKALAIRNRIQDMTRNGTLSRMDWLGWPIMPVFDEKKDIVGFAMRACTGKSLMSLCGPVTVMKNFPAWNRRNLVETALDFVQKLKLLASHRVMVNDFNPANFLVDGTGKVSFLDCDSFQVPASSGRTHISHTHFPSYSAPELLKDPSLLAAPRTIHQVEFGAALIVFHIIMCGLHPYSHCDPGKCNTPEDNLLSGHCPLGKGADCGIPDGWYNLWSYLSFKLKDAFIATFRNGHSDPAARTTLARLEAELKRMLFVIDKNPGRDELMPKTAKPQGAFLYFPAGTAGFGQQIQGQQ